MAPTTTAAPSTTAASETTTSAAAGKTDLILASTTSTQDSGLFDVLIPAFNEAYPAVQRQGRRRRQRRSPQAGRDRRRRRPAGPLARRREDVHDRRLRRGPQGRHVQRLHHRRPGGRSGRHQGHDRSRRTPSRRSPTPSRSSSAAATSPAPTPRNWPSGRRPASPRPVTGIRPPGQGMGETLTIADQKGGYTLDRPRHLACQEGHPQGLWRSWWRATRPSSTSIT